MRHLITAHPIGGCPMGENYERGAVDESGRVFAGDGRVHDGLFVADGAVIPTSIGVNPFLTISALAEHIAERKIHELGGAAYADPPIALDTQPDPSRDAPARFLRALAPTPHIARRGCARCPCRWCP